MRSITGFLISVEYGELEEVKKYLDHGVVNINDANTIGETALHKAAGAGNVEMCKLLLGYPNIAVDYADVAGCTPLCCAVFSGYEEVVKLLLDNKASTSVSDKYGDTVLHIMAKSPLLYESRDFIAYLLLEADAKPNAMGFKGLTPLTITAEFGYYSTCRLLMQYGADVDKCTDWIKRVPGFIEVAEIARDTLEYNCKSILDSVGYSIAVSKQLLPFELVQKIAEYYSAPYWHEKFDSEIKEELMGIVFPSKKLETSITQLDGVNDQEFYELDASLDNEGDAHTHDVLGYNQKVHETSSINILILMGVGVNDNSFKAVSLKLCQDSMEGWGAPIFIKKLQQQFTEQALLIHQSGDSSTPGQVSHLQLQQNIPGYRVLELSFNIIPQRFCIKIGISDIYLVVTYRHEINKFFEILERNDIKSATTLPITLDILWDHGEFKKQVLFPLHPDKGGNAQDFAFVRELQQKMKADIDIHTIIAEKAQKAQVWLYKATVGIKAADTVVDVLRAVNQPTIENGKRLVFDAVHLYGMYNGLNGYSLAIGGLEASYQIYHGEYVEALKQALTTGAYMALPMVMAASGIPYSGVIFAVGMTTYSAYHFVSKAQALYVEYTSQDNGAKSAEAYTQLYSSLAQTPLQYVYDFESSRNLNEDSAEQASSLQEVAHRYISEWPENQ
ncbi:ankyrin repeat domain-containing protein [Rickettsiales endosymbiont of Peranema trichophorum]|uniref:ankyrin repeat domain-containing protein n=1 Tax=Rickettsiales endosymbiont of Peranema trichophorum TaxID=2486577 RepID=UPI0013EE7C2B|nr:ankyrin repeat domain-containing protein [Rickettsiales endosymbiont of Peranema trichophorum]